MIYRFIILLIAVVSSSILSAQEYNILPTTGFDRGSGILQTTPIGEVEYMASPMVSPSFSKRGGKDRSDDALEREEELNSRAEQIKESERTPPESNVEFTKPRYYYVESDYSGNSYTLRSSQYTGATLISYPHIKGDSLPDDIKISPYLRDPNIEITSEIAPSSIDKVGNGYFLSASEIEAITAQNAIKNDIETIEVLEDRTIITISMIPAANLFWFSISELTYIEDCKTGKKYHMQGVEDGIPSGRLVVVVDPPQYLRLKLIFPPLPESVRTINVIRKVNHEQIPTNTTRLVGGDRNLNVKAYSPKRRHRNL